MPIRKISKVLQYQKENVGEFKNLGRTWTKKGQAKEVNVYDFPSLGVGRATPYGIYDLKRNEGMVNVGISYDTSEFAVESIRQWWIIFGRNNYPNAKGLMICADGGGSNGSRNKGWKFHLQELVNQINTLGRTKRYKISPFSFVFTSQSILSA
jgi:hypothetical protein